MVKPQYTSCYPMFVTRDPYLGMVRPNVSLELMKRTQNVCIATVL